jgi:hypothetical protein
MMHVKHAFRMLNCFRTILDVVHEHAMGIEVRHLRCMRRASNGCGYAMMRLRVPVDIRCDGCGSPCSECQQTLCAVVCASLAQAWGAEVRRVNCNVQALLDAGRWARTVCVRAHWYSRVAFKVRVVVRTRLTF